jgi:hypothetical protein
MKFSDPARAVRTTNRDIAADRDLVTLETLRKKGPVHRRRGFLIYTIIVDATDNADNLAPIIFCADANALAQGVARIPKHFARHIFGDCAHRKLFVGVLPGEISARDKGNAQNFKKAGGDKPESSQRWTLAFGIGLALDQDGVLPALTGHRGSCVDAYRGGASDGGDAAHNFLFHANRGLTWVSGIETRKVWTCAGAVNPGTTFVSARKVRIMRPEQIRSTRASATCTTTRALRARCVRDFG